MTKYDVAGLGEFVVGAETKVGVLFLCGRVHKAPLISTERQFLVVICDDVLTQFWPHLLNEVAKVPDDGEVAQDGCLLYTSPSPRDS